MRLGKLILAGAAALLAAAGAEAAEKGGKVWVFVGTYTGPKSKGIYRYELDTATGKLGGGEVAAESTSPSFLAIDPKRRFLFSVNEVSDFRGRKSGAVSSFALDPKTGKLTSINQQSTVGDGPCHIVADRTGTHVLLANYGGGSVAVLPYDGDGKLAAASCFVQHKGSGPNNRRQEAPHAHSINLDAAGRFAAAADLGLDKVYVYKYDPEKGVLTPNDPPFTTTAPGAGPRHFAFHPSAPFAYVCGEMDSTVTAFRYDAEKGTLTKLQTLSTLPEGGKPGNSTAEVQVHPSGKFVYVSNRGHDSIAGFTVDAKTGELTPAGRQGDGIKVPRNFGIDPSGKWMLVASQDGDNIAVFAIDPETGALKPTGTKVNVGTPVCVKFVLQGG